MQDHSKEPLHKKIAIVLISFQSYRKIFMGTKSSNIDKTNGNMLFKFLNFFSFRSFDFDLF